MQNRLKSSIAELQNLRTLATCAVLVALYVAIDTASVYVTPTMQLTFSFLVLALLGYRFGTFAGTIAGLACDLIAYLIRPAGPLHLGFTLSTMLTVFIFALFLYRRELKLWRIILSKSAINIGVNIFLNTYWLSNLYDKAYVVLFWERTLKNLVLLPIEIALAWFVLKAFEQITRRISNR